MDGFQGYNKKKTGEEVIYHNRQGDGWNKFLLKSGKYYYYNFFRDEVLDDYFLYENNVKYVERK